MRSLSFLFWLIVAASVFCQPGWARDVNNYVSVSASSPGDANHPSLTVKFFRDDHWSIPKTAALLYRTTSLEGTTNWGSPVATLAWGTSAYVDTNVTVGQRYLYRLVVDGPTNETPVRTIVTFVTGGIATPAVENRKTILLITDNVTAPQLVPEITRLKQDLIGDGYRVQEISVAPTDTPPAVKALIVAAYQAAPTQVSSVILLGNVPIPYSGWVNPDGHGSRPFPTDSYYADINGTWTDSTRNSNNTSGNYAWWVNTPGDGKFDQSKTPSEVDLQIGRITFRNMPAFAQTDVQLLRRYLDKNHAYRQGQFTFNRNVYIGIESDTGYAASGPLFGTNYRPFVQTGAAAYYQPYWDEQAANGYWLTTWVRGGGAYISTWGIGSTQDYANATAVNTAIHAAWASYYGEWDVSNAFLRAMLAARGQTVGVFYDESPSWLLYALGMGETMGFAARMSINQTGVALDSRSSQYADSIIPSLLGDPSIRFFTVKPPGAAVGQVSGSTVSLSWQASSDPSIQGYLIHRASTLEGNFVRINDALVTGTTFVDPNPMETNIYMVRAQKLQVTGSGTYHDLSQGAFTNLVTMPVDTDEDGLPDDWEETHLQDIQTSDGTGDFDGDGSLDLHEFQAGTLPNDSKSLLKILVSKVGDGGEMEISFSAVEGKAYTLLATPSLAPSNWEPVQTGIVGVSPTTFVSVPLTGETSYFYRIKLD